MGGQISMRQGRDIQDGVEEGMRRNGMGDESSYPVRIIQKRRHN
jgi:hypothetical protein